MSSTITARLFDSANMSGESWALMLGHLLCSEPGQVCPCHISSPGAPRQYDGTQAWRPSVGAASEPCLSIAGKQCTEGKPASVFGMQLWSKQLPPTSFAHFSSLVPRYLGTHFSAVTVLFMDICLIQILLSWCQVENLT